MLVTLLLPFLPLSGSKAAELSSKIAFNVRSSEFLFATIKSDES